MNITVLGDGAWGTACASLLAQNGHQVTLWCINNAVAHSITTTNVNHLYLPGISLPSSIKATTSLEEALKNSFIFEAIPIVFMRDILIQCAPFKRAGTIWVSLSKGIEKDTFLFPTAIIRDVFGPETEVAALSGPSFAREVAQNEPTIVTLAAQSQSTIKTLIPLIANDSFIVTPTDDLVGVELSGALKNVFALGVGLLSGAGFGSNTQVLFVLQCLEELKALFVALNGREETLYGPAGIGDLMLTCFSCQSRNMRLGKMIGEGKNLASTLAQNTLTAEGLNTLPSICARAKKHTITLPCCDALFSIIFKNAPLENLLAALRSEHHR